MLLSFDNVFDVNSPPPLVSMQLRLNCGYTNSKNYNYKLITKYWRWFQVNFFGANFTNVILYTHIEFSVAIYANILEHRIAKGRGSKSNENTDHLYWVRANGNEWTFPKTFEMYKIIILLTAIAGVIVSSYEYTITVRRWVQFNEFMGDFIIFTLVRGKGDLWEIIQ